MRLFLNLYETRGSFSLLVSVNPLAAFKITKPNLANNAKSWDVLLPVKRYPET
jgi:hypothetical protein